MSPHHNQNQAKEPTMTKIKHQTVTIPLVCYSSTIRFAMYACMHVCISNPCATYAYTHLLMQDLCKICKCITFVHIMTVTLNMAKTRVNKYNVYEENNP